VRLVLRKRVCRDQALLFHNPSDPTSGQKKALFQQLHFEFSRSIGFAVFTKDFDNRYRFFFFNGSFFRFIIKGTS